MSNIHKPIDWKITASTAELLSIPGKKIVVISHINPDGDALGSSLALTNLFRKIGHQCHVILPNDYPEFLKWLPGIEQVVVLKHNHTKSLEIINAANLIFAVDFNELKRVKDLNEAFECSRAHKVLIDHHPEPGMKVDCLLSDITASSTAELVYHFFTETNLRSFLDKDIAECLFTGIMTDTGCFSYNASGRKTWETVAELLDYGINKDRIYALVYDNYSADRMRLLGFCLNEKMEVYPEFGTGFIALSREDMQKYHFQVGDSEGFVNYPLSIKGVCFSALFIEKEDHVRISFRSKGDFAVNDFSRKYFRGGGHRNASGGESFASLSETISRFKDLLPKYKEKLCKDE